MTSHLQSVSALGGPRALVACITALLVWVAAGPALGAELSGNRQADLRATLFVAADEALAAANQERASLLAPRSYSDGAQSYQRAESILESGGDIDGIQRNLARAQEATTLAQGYTQRQRWATGRHAQCLINRIVTRDTEV